MNELVADLLIGRVAPPLAGGEHFVLRRGTTRPYVFSEKVT